MAYQALYRTYRPRRFDEVVGQEHITRTLKNQIIKGRIGHAYLFSGSRGTGKTTTARLLARAINCETPEDGEPCEKCASCEKSRNENADIIELDAASNNGVDDMRSLLERAHFTPLALKRKVYIIDEAHMVTSSAFNALLKTLEEPPEHVVFILATTEPQKLIPTVVSRCQRFDFCRLSVPDIIANLTSVLEKTGVSMDDDGMAHIARAADGGMRDALSLADRCITFSNGDNITVKDVFAILGNIEEDALFSMCDSIVEGNSAAVFRDLATLIDSGRDISLFVQDLIAHVRALLLTKTCGAQAKSILGCTDQGMSRYLAQSNNTSEAALLRMLETLIQAGANLRYSRAPRVLVECALLVACRPADDMNLLALEARVAALEAREQAAPKVMLESTAPSVQPAVKVEEVKIQAASPQAPKPSYDDPPPWDDVPPQATTPQAVKPQASKPSHDDPPPWDDVPPPASWDDVPPPASWDDAPPEHDVPWDDVPPPNVPDVMDAWEDVSPAPVAPAPVASAPVAPAPVAPAPVVPAPAASAQPSAARATSRDANALLEAMRARLQKINISALLMLRGVSYSYMDGSTIVLNFPKSQQSSYKFFRVQRNAAMLKQALDEMGEECDVHFTIGQNKPPINTAAAAPAAPPTASEAPRTSLDESQLQALFGGKLTFEE